jgi:hypothetical protein
VKYAARAFTITSCIDMVNVFLNLPPILREMILLNFVLRKVESGKHDLNAKSKTKSKR